LFGVSLAVRTSVGERLTPSFRSTESFLNGREKLKDFDVFSLLHYDK